MGLSRIAYVEDDDDIREVTEFALTHLGHFEVRTYASGAEALEHLDAFAPELILLDVIMPEMDGKTLFGHIKERAALADVPIAFMTAKALQNEKDDLRDLGAVGVISKPFDPISLPNEVRGLWEAGRSDV